MPQDNKTLIDQIAVMAGAGMAVPVDPDAADLMAAFEDDALSPEDALASRFDDVAEGDE
jgi:hypothetical protein